MRFNEFSKMTDDELKSIDGWNPAGEQKIDYGDLVWTIKHGYLLSFVWGTTGMNFWDVNGDAFPHTDVVPMYLNKQSEFDLPAPEPQTGHECTVCGTAGAYRGFTQEECLNEACDLYSEAWRKQCSPSATQEEQPVATTKTDTTEYDGPTLPFLRMPAALDCHELHKAVERELSRGIPRMPTEPRQSYRGTQTQSKPGDYLYLPANVRRSKETSDDSSPSRTTSGQDQQMSDFQNHLPIGCLYVSAASPEVGVVTIDYAPCTPSQGQPSAHRDCIRPPAPEAPAETPSPDQQLGTPTTIQLCLFCARLGCRDMQCVR